MSQKNILKVALIISCAILSTTFVLIPTTLSWDGLWGGLAVFSVGCLLPLYKPQWLRSAYYALAIGLLFSVTVVSFDLWETILSGERIKSSLHVLVLALSLLLACGLYILSLNIAYSTPRDSINLLVAAGMRSPPLLISVLLAVILCSVLLAFLYITENAFLKVIAVKLLDRGIIPPITLSLFLWGGLLLLGKWLFMRHQLTIAQTGDSVFHRAYQLDSHKACEDFSGILWQQFESFYNLPRYINWAIPILGFIGTVLGISLATEKLSVILSNTNSDFGKLLSEALSPLGIAFDTTLVALSLSVVLALSQTLLYRWEESRLLQLEEALKKAGSN